VSSGQNFDRRMVESLPMFSNMPIMLSRFTPGVAPREAEVQNVFQGTWKARRARGRAGRHGKRLRQPQHRQQLHDRRRPEQRLRPPHRQLAQLGSDRGVRIETSNFDASQGHGTGLTVSMMTRGGTNTLRGSATTRTGTTGQLAQPAAEDRVQAGPAPGSRVPQGREHIGAFTLGGPLVNSRRSSTARQGVLLRQLTRCRTTRRRTPRRQLHRAGHAGGLDGDFSDLLQLPSAPGATTPAGHQVPDLSTR
jgi:hypothetical protein